MKKDIELTRRKVLASTALVGAAGATAGAGTWAFFSDEETAEDNTISAGTIDLDVNAGDGFSYTWGNAAPGESYSDVQLPFSNTGSIDAEELVIETTVEGDTDLAEYIDLEFEYSNGDAPASQTLADLAAGEVTLGGIDAGGSTTLTIGATFASDAGNDLQGASIDIDHTFTLRQVAGQDE
ncbi:hypothetical protein EL22_00490 [Halostagnicola sp. A56]|uniref:TasA family protein n=1 Tax=Halostagnicola sp. A56 TaxID=1495067 RepID=UPI00049F79BE|nr:TasA family protein [Halostagnicola sp. A56]KDE59062.1 hypothetical protein EL22_00490 [Halostagnicola sp. A56]